MNKLYVIHGNGYNYKFYTDIWNLTAKLKSKYECSKKVLQKHGIMRKYGWIEGIYLFLLGMLIKLIATAESFLFIKYLL